ncbi:MAG: thiamine pyrophosphate-dependent enzyme [Candidatus Bipolaricaulia bacterium]
MTHTYEPERPIWCAGCGDFGVQAALTKALTQLSVPPEDVVTIAGIGCSGTIQNNISFYGYHALHGRTLPTAIGVKLANPQLTVIVAGGDGDGYAIGMGHLMHAFKRNPSIVYIVMNNGTYGLTKGQFSPTSDADFRGNVEESIDAIWIGLSVGTTTFIARGFAGYPDQLTRLMAEAIEHTHTNKGFAFLEVLSPCVTYNDTYRLWKSAMVDLDADPSHSPDDRVAAYTKVNELRESGCIPIGMVYRGEHPSFETVSLSSLEHPMATQDISVSVHATAYKTVMDSFKG